MAHFLFSLLFVVSIANAFILSVLNVASHGKLSPGVSDSIATHDYRLACIDNSSCYWTYDSGFFGTNKYYESKCNKKGRYRRCALDCKTLKGSVSGLVYIGTCCYGTYLLGTNMKGPYPSTNTECNAQCAHDCKTNKAVISSRIDTDGNCVCRASKP